MNPLMIMKDKMLPTDPHLDEEVIKPRAIKSKEKLPPNLAKKNVYNNTYIKPLAFAGAAIAIVGLTGTFYLMAPEEERLTVDGGEANSIKVDHHKDGRDQLNPDQAAYLSEQNYQKAQRNAREGVTTAAVISRPDATVQNVSTQSATFSDSSAITREYKNTPKTIAQLEAENEAAGGELYSRGADNNGYIVFVNKNTGQEVVPVDKKLAKGYSAPINMPNNNATYNTSSNSGYSNQGYDGSGNDGGSGGYNNNNGGNSGNASADNQQDQRQNQPPPPDPRIEARRTLLHNDFEAYQAQEAALAAQEQEQRARLQEQQAAIRQYRQQLANDALNNAISNVQQTVGQKNGYAAISYYKPQQNAQQGQNTNNQRPIPSSPVAGNNTATAGSSNINVGFGNSNVGQDSRASQPSSPPLRLPQNIVRAGTKWPVVITKEVNSDEGLQVIGQVMGGQFSGSTIYGTLQPSGRNVGVVFSTIAPKNPRKPLIPVSSYATTIGTQKTAISNDVKHHYFQNYGIKSLTSVLRGVGDAYDGAGETTIITDGGNVITTKSSNPDSDKIKADVLKELGKDLTADIAKIGNRAPTYKIPTGTVVHMVLSSDLDVNGTTSTISNQTRLSGNGQPRQ